MERQIITNITQLNGNLCGAANQVSAMIAEYNSQFPFEMLPKTPEVIVEQLNRGLSIIMTESETNPSRVLFHGTLYPSLENGLEKKLGCQVVECGSWIVNSDYRGHGIGTQGVGMLVNLGKKNWDPALFIATHKRMAALKVSGNIGFSKVAYQDFPYLSYLTCTCSNCSERCGFQSCIFRGNAFGAKADRKGKIDCTLMVSDAVLAEKFEDTCRSFHTVIGEPLKKGDITTISMLSAEKFFKWIETA